LSAYLKTVLVVDDKESIRIAISLVLEDFGYSVRCAEDGHSALRKIHQQSPDILVSDLAMPGMSIRIADQRQAPIPSNQGDCYERFIQR